MVRNKLKCALQICVMIHNSKNNKINVYTNVCRLNLTNKTPQVLILCYCFFGPPCKIDQKDKTKTNKQKQKESKQTKANKTNKQKINKQSKAKQIKTKKQNT